MSGLLPPGPIRPSIKLSKSTGELDLGDVGELYAIDMDDEDVGTVGGLPAKILDRVPGASAVVPLPEDPSYPYPPDRLRLTAETVAGRRNQIGALLVVPVTPVPQSTSGKPMREGGRPVRPRLTRSGSAGRPRCP
ncbi:hypothetical protein ACFWP7_36170 [Streptomyces sp. NPDC058470]|uniref:hypothetical protein n=1 Tax=Streptomyces sp. NPDC058470 TaxID=3346515 RepID=UPI00365CBC49